MKKSQFKIGVILAYILIFVNLIYGFFVSPYLIKHLTSANYGAYKTIASLMGTVSVLDFGISSTAIRYLSKFFAEKDEQSSKSFMGMIIYQAILIVLVIAVAGVVLYFSLDNLYGSSDLGINVDPGLSISKKLFILLLINTVLGVPYSIFNAVIVAHKDYLFANMSKVLRILFQLAALIVVVPLPIWGGSSLSVGFVLITISSLSLLADFLYVVLKIKIKINFKIKLIPKWIIKESLVFTLLSFVQTVLIQFEGNIDNILIGKYISSEAVTTYSLALLFYSVFNQLSTAISNLMLPSVSQKIADGATDRDLETLTIKVGRIQFMILGGALFGFISCGRMFISIWVGESQSLVWSLGIILMVATLLPLIENVALAVIRAKNKILFRTIVVLIGTIFNFAITLISVSVLKINTDMKLILACVGTAISLLGANMLSMNLYYKKILHFRPLYIFKSIFDRTIVCLLPPTIIAFFFTMFLDNTWINFISIVVIFVFIYAVCLMYYGMSEEEKKILFGKIIKFEKCKSYIVEDKKILYLIPNDLLSTLNGQEKESFLIKNIDYSFDDSLFKVEKNLIDYNDGLCVVVDESTSNNYSFVDFFKNTNCERLVIICHREYFSFYKKAYGIKSFLKTNLSSKELFRFLNPRKKERLKELKKNRIIKTTILSLFLASFSFGLAYTMVDYSPEKVSSFIMDNYDGPVYCKITPSSYPVNPFLSDSFNANQASTPSFEYFYSKEYLKNNNSVYIYEKTDSFSPFQYKKNSEYIDSTLITSNFVSLNDEQCFLSLGLELLASSDDYSENEENVVVISYFLAQEMFGSVETAVGSTIDFYLYNFQKIRTTRTFRIVGVFDYLDNKTYYAFNKPQNLFVTNAKTVSMGWSGFEYLFSLPKNLEKLDDSIFKILQIENTFTFGRSFYTVVEESETMVQNVTPNINNQIKKYTILDISLMSFVLIGYCICIVLVTKLTHNIKSNYYDVLACRRANVLAIALFAFVSLAVDLLLLYLLPVKFVWRIIVLPILIFLVLSLVFPRAFIAIFGKIKK